MARFSERHSIVPEASIQLDEISDSTRNRIWNRIKIFLPDYYADRFFCEQFSIKLFDNLGLDADQAFYYVADKVDELIHGAEWFEVYDLIELILQLLHAETAGQLACGLNNLFEADKCAYRIVQTKLDDQSVFQVTSITNELELREIQEAVQTEHEAVNKLLGDSLAMYSDKTNPDYAGSMRAAISAVESAFKIINPKAKTLGDALKALQKQGVVKHVRLIETIDKLYGFANETVRHGQRENPEITQAEAKLILVTCSAIVNYVFEESVSIGE